MSGFIKLYRKTLRSNMYKNLNSKQRDVFYTCLLLASYSNNEWEWNGEKFKCEPGQFVTSLESIASNCAKDVKVQSVRTALLKLEKWQFLTNISTKTGRLITICNWDNYQSIEGETNKDINKELTKDQQRANKELTTIKKEKKEKKVENIPTLEEIFNYFKDVTNDGVFAHLYGSDFFDWYENTNWTYKKRGKDVTPIKNWKLKAREWIRRDYPKFEQQQKQIEIPKEPVYSIPKSFDTYNDPANPWNQ